MNVEMQIIGYDLMKHGVDWTDVALDMRRNGFYVGILRHLDR